MGEVGKIWFITVVEETEKKEKHKERFRYGRPVLQSTLQLMGCKSRHSFKVRVTHAFVIIFSLLIV